MRCRAWMLCGLAACGGNPPEETETEATESSSATDTDTESETDTETDPDGLTEAAFRTAFVTELISLWDGVDYTARGDGTDGIDGAGTVIYTLQAMGYDVPVGTADDIGSNRGFAYTTPGDATHEQLSSGDLSALQEADLLLLDYDFDETWDHVAVFTGRTASEAFTASDYYDECGLADLADTDDPLTLDLIWSLTGSAHLDYGAIEAAWTGR